MQFLRLDSGTGAGSGETISIGPAVDSEGVEYSGLVIGDLTLVKNGVSAPMAANAALTYDDNGFYDLVMIGNNADTLGRLMIRCNKVGYQIPPREFMVVPAMIYDSLILGTDRLDTNQTHIEDNDATDWLTQLGTDIVASLPQAADVANLTINDLLATSNDGTPVGTQWSRAAHTVAKWYVSQANGDDSNTGRTPASAFETLTEALSNYTDGDTIYLIDGTFTGTYTISKHNVTLVNLGTAVISDTVGTPLTITGHFCTLINIAATSTGSTDVWGIIITGTKGTKMLGVTATGKNDGVMAASTTGFYADNYCNFIGTWDGINIQDSVGTIIRNSRMRTTCTYSTSNFGAAFIDGAISATFENCLFSTFKAANNSNVISAIKMNVGGTTARVINCFQEVQAIDNAQTGGVYGIWQIEEGASANIEVIGGKIALVNANVSGDIFDVDVSIQPATRVRLFNTLCDPTRLAGDVRFIEATHTGDDGDTLETLSDQLDALSSGGAAIASGTFTHDEGGNTTITLDGAFATDDFTGCTLIITRVGDAGQRYTKEIVSGGEEVELTSPVEFETGDTWDVYANNPSSEDGGGGGGEGTDHTLLYEGEAIAAGSDPETLELDSLDTSELPAGTEHAGAMVKVTHDGLVYTSNLVTVSEARDTITVSPEFDFTVEDGDAVVILAVAKSTLFAGGRVPSNLSTEPVSSNKVFLLVNGSNGFESEDEKVLIAGAEAEPYGVEFRNAASPSQVISTVDSVELVEGDENGLTIGSEHERDGNTEARFTLAGVTPGTYRVRVQVSMPPDTISTGDIRIRVRS